MSSLTHNSCSKSLKLQAQEVRLGLFLENSFPTEFVKPAHLTCTFRRQKISSFSQVHWSKEHCLFLIPELGKKLASKCDKVEPSKGSVRFSPSATILKLTDN